MRKNLCASLTRSFVTTASAYKQAQEQYKLEVKNKLRRQVRNVQPHLTDDDIDHLLQQENGQRDAVYQQLVLQGSINHQVQSAVDQVADKYLVIQSLEASIAVLHQMFLDMSLLTHEQGLELDRIEIQVQQTNEHVEEGNVNVAKSIHYQTKIRKKRRWIVAIVLVIIIIAVVAPLLL